MNFAENKYLVRIGLSIEDRARVAQGGVVGDRVSPFNLDAKTDVRSLEVHYGGGDADQRFKAGRAIAQLFTNEDVVLYVPQAVLECPTTAAITIPPDRLISTASEEYLAHYRALLPSMGYMVAFEF